MTEKRITGRKNYYSKFYIKKSVPSFYLVLAFFYTFLEHDKAIFHAMDPIMLANIVCHFLEIYFVL